MAESPPLAPLGREHEAGFSILESAIAMTITAVLLQIVVSSTLVLNQSTHFGNKQIQTISKAELGLQKMRYELVRSSSDTDPDTSLPYMTVTGDEGDRSITFRRVVDWVEKLGEVTAVWSTEITFDLVDGTLARIQDGNTTTILRGVTVLDFELDGEGRVTAMLTVTDLNPNSSSLEVSRALSITPGF